MSRRISNSQVDKFTECPYKWYLYYVERIRTIYHASSLFFGTALDEAFSRLLLEKKAPETYTEAELALAKFSAVEVFKKTLKRQQFNGETHSLSKSIFTSYFKSDFDYALLTEEDFQSISALASETNLEVSTDSVKDFVDECFEIARKGQLAKEERLVLNYACWLSLYRKGLLILEAYENTVLPVIDEVFSIQKLVELAGTDGNVYIGYIDFTARLVGEDFVRVMDNKTSSKPYAPDSVRTSTQLASYCEFEETPYAGYVVAEKPIRKKEPRARVNILLDEIPEEQFELTFDRIASTMESIESCLATGEFPKAKDREGGAKKNCFFYGRPCENWNLCNGDGNMNGLVKLEKDNE